MNGDAEEKSDRNSPEVNSQEQMAAQRASGGVIQAPEVYYRDQISDFYQLAILASDHISYLLKLIINLHNILSIYR